MTPIILVVPVIIGAILYQEVPREHDWDCLTETGQIGVRSDKVEGCKPTHRVVTTYLYPAPTRRHPFKDKCETLQHAEARKHDLDTSQHGPEWYKSEVVPCNP